MISDSLLSRWSELTSKKDNLTFQLLILSVISLATLWYLFRKAAVLLPPGPRGLPVLGSLPFLGPNLHHEFTKLAQRYGPIFKLYLGSKTYIIVSSSDLAKEVVRVQDDVFANRDPPMAGITITYGAKNILWSDNNSYWRNMRKVFVSEVLSNKNLEASHTFRRAGVRKIIKHVYNETMGSEVDVGGIAFTSSLSVVTSMMWGKSLDGDEKNSNLGVGWIHSPKGLEQVVGLNNIVEESHLPKLRYLDAVIKETFRLHPPLPLLIGRCPNQACNVGGYTVPKGSNVFLNVWAIHRDPQYWENPTEFDPNRFLNPDGTTKFDYLGNNTNFLAFGSGRRRCPGVPLGEKMLVHLLASLLHSFDWTLPNDKQHELSDKFGIVMKKRNPLMAIPSQRLPDKNLYM